MNLDLCFYADDQIDTNWWIRVEQFNDEDVFEQCKEYIWYHYMTNVMTSPLLQHHPIRVSTDIKVK